jgi:peptide/nickel transport system substrate-binding protein
MSSSADGVDNLIDAFMGRRIDRGQFLRRAVGLGLTLPAATALLAACGGGSSGGGTGGGGSGGAKGPDVLKVRILNDMANLDPAFWPASADLQVAYPIYEGLITYKYGSTETVNVLAETFTPSADGLSFDFTLKKGIQFHGGYGEVTAEDVKFSYERIAGLTKPKIEAVYRGDWSPALKEVKVNDKYSGTIILKERFAAVTRSTLPVSSGWIVSKKAVEELGDKYATKPIGTGPYEFASWTPKQSVVLKRFAQYGNASPAEILGDKFKEIHFIPIEDSSAADIALETGEVHFGEVGLDSISRFESNSAFSLSKQTTLNYNWIGMNVLHPKLQDIRVRQAIRLAIDVPGILEGAFEGRMTRATGIIPPNMGLGYWQDAPVHERDVEEAKRLLNEAGVSNLSLSLMYTEETGSKQLAQIAQQNLKEVGIDLSLKLVDSAAMYELGKNLKERELFYVGYVSQLDPSWSTVWFTCSQFDEWNWMYWCDERYDKLHFDAVKEADEAKRNAMYIEMQQRWDEASHTVWTHWPTIYFGTTKLLKPAVLPTGYFVAHGFRSA